MKVSKKQIQQICDKLKVNLISFDYLGRGSHNVSYVINTSQDRFVLRINDSLQIDNLRMEYKFLKRTKGKLGPRVYFFDDSKKILNRPYFIEEFIEGKHPKKVDSKYLRLMAKWYKDLHRIKIKRKMLALHKRIGVKKYKKFNHLLDADVKSDMDGLYNKTIEIFKKNQKPFKNIKYLSLNHGDPTRTNVFYNGESVRLIDWEMVNYNIPELDLVFFVWSYNLNKKQKNLFLNAYGFPNTKTAKKKFDLRLLAHIWSIISWRLERLNLVYEKKMKNTGYCSSKEVIYKENEEDIAKIKKILKRLK